MAGRLVTARSRRAKAIIGLAAVIALLGGTLALAAAPASAGSTIFLDGFQQLNPDTVTQGALAQDQISVFNNPENATAHSVVLEVSLFSTTDGPPGTFALNAMKAMNPGISCKFATNSEGGGINTAVIDCQLGTINPGDSPLVNALIDTTGVSPADGPALEIDMQLFSTKDSVSCGESCGPAFLFVNSGSSTQTDTFVPPGGTAFVGPKTPDAADPTVGSFTLPKKENTALTAAVMNTSNQPGPGATVSLVIHDPTDFPGACGGTFCAGKVVVVSDFSGYNDPKHPALFALKWWGGLHLDPTQPIFIIKGGIGTALTKCTKTHGAFNTPCLAKQKFIKKTGEIDATMAILSGDPGGGHK
jgi:hypothetical protein